MNHIPKAARPACADKLKHLLVQVCNKPADHSAWCNLFNFAPDILAKPARGGANRNITNIVLKRINQPRTPTSPSGPIRKPTHQGKQNSDKLRCAAVCAKLEAGNFKAAVRILCSDESPAPTNCETLKVLRSKHPPAASDKLINTPNPHDYLYDPIQVTSECVRERLKSFPNGSSGGPDGLTAQHIRDLTDGTADDSLISAITDFVNLLLRGDLSQDISEIIFGGRMIALRKKDGGLRPIAVGYTLRRLAAKCANHLIIKTRSQFLQPLQVGVGIPGGAEAAVHATRRLLQNLPDGHVFAKIDFKNAFNTISRNDVLRTVASATPGLYRFVHSSLAFEPILTFGDDIIRSAEGVQQGDPLGSWEFCETTHPLLLNDLTEIALAYIDDSNFEGPIDQVAASFQRILDLGPQLGLQVNESKCEITANDLDIIRAYPIFRHFQSIPINDFTLLGTPVMSGEAVDRVLHTKTKNLKTAISRLANIPRHDALCLLKNSIAIPKLLYTLRTASCFDSAALTEFDRILREGLEQILNIHMSDVQWDQATLPVQRGGLGIRSAVALAHSAFLASAAATVLLQDSILAPTKNRIGRDRTLDDAEGKWMEQSGQSAPLADHNLRQYSWDNKVCDAIVDRILATSSTATDQARLRAASAEHAGDWLNAPPISSIGLKLSDEAVRVAVGYRLGTSICHPHICPCGAVVDAKGLHALACGKGSARHIRHTQLNDVIWRSLKRAHIPAIKEPNGLLRSDGKRPDGVTLIPWARGVPMAWDVTVPDTFANSYISSTAVEAGAAAERAAAIKRLKYAEISKSHRFVPIAIESGGPWNAEAKDMFNELGRRTAEVTKDPRETSFLYQRMSITLQRGNAIAFSNSFTDSDTHF